MLRLARVFVLVLSTCLLVGVAHADASSSTAAEVVRWTDQARSLDYAELHLLKARSANDIVRQLMTDDIRLARPIVVEISERPSVFYDHESGVISVPLANLYRVHDDLKAKFPEQEDVRLDIYYAAFQFYVLSEFLRAVSMDLELRISGWEAERIDALVSVFLLESDVVSQPYILDAAEEFLLIDRVAASIDSQRFKTEFEADEYRLSQILCLMKAYDATSMDVRWDDDQGCSGYYRHTMEFWSKVLDDHLMESSRLKRWGQAPSSMDEPE